MAEAVDFVEINGARLAYRICGAAGAPLIITLHGGRGMAYTGACALGDHRSDFGAYKPLEADGYRVLSFDFRGHGQSSATKPYTFEQIVDDVEGLRLHFAGASRVIVCGGSFGGFLALHYAIKYATAVSHLVLRGTAPSYHHEDDAVAVLEQRLHRAPGFSATMLRAKVFGRYESDLEFRLVHLAMAPLYSENFDADEALRSCLANVYNAEAHNDLYSPREKYFDYRAQLAHITAKTLVVVGDRDWICPLPNSQHIANGIPGADLLVVEGANHSVHLEKNQLVLDAIRKHLRP